MKKIDLSDSLLDNVPVIGVESWGLRHIWPTFKGEYYFYAPSHRGNYLKIIVYVIFQTHNIELFCLGHKST